MPLKKGKKNFSYNVKELVKAGHPQNQAVAIAYKQARMYEGGEVQDGTIVQGIDNPEPIRTNKKAAEQQANKYTEMGTQAPVDKGAYNQEYLKMAFGGEVENEYGVTAEHEDHFVVRKGPKEFKVAKKGLSREFISKIQHMADGGEVQDETPPEMPAPPPTEEQQAPSNTFGMPVNETSVTIPQSEWQQPEMAPQSLGLAAQASTPPPPGPEVAVQTDQGQVAPKSPDSSFADPMEAYKKAYQLEHQGNVQALAGNQIQSANDLQAANTLIAGQQNAYQEFQDRVKPIMANLDRVTQDTASQKIDYNRVWGNMSTGNRVLAGISILLGGIGQGLLKSNHNAALDAINQTIERDVQTQKAQMDQKNNLYKMYLSQVHNEQEAELLAKSHMTAMFQGQLARSAAMSNDPKAMAQYKMAEATIQNQQGDRAMQLAQFGIQRHIATQQFGPELLPFMGKDTDTAVRLPNGMYGKATSKEGAKEANTAIGAYQPLLKAFDTLDKLPQLTAGLPYTQASQMAAQAQAQAASQIAKMKDVQFSSRTADLLKQMTGGDPKSYLSGAYKPLIQQGRESAQSDLESKLQSLVPAFKPSYKPKSFKR